MALPSTAREQNRRGIKLAAPQTGKKVRTAKTVYSISFMINIGGVFGLMHKDICYPVDAIEILSSHSQLINGQGKLSFF